MLRMMFLGMAVAAAPASAQDSAEIAGALLAPWAPESTSMEEGGALRIVLPQRRVTAEIYSPIIRHGLCLGPLAAGEPLKDVTSIEVLNQFEAQGYVYEKGLEDCEKISSAGPKVAEMTLMSATHMFVPDR